MRMRDIMLLAGGLACWAPAASGQTRFAWPDTVVSWSRYTTVEQCEAALDRTQRATYASSPNNRWQDTVADLATFIPESQRVRIDEARRTSSAAAAKIAQSCMARFAAVDSVPRELLAPYTKLYLAAGWDAKIQPLLDRIAANAPAELGQALDTVVDVMGGRPADRYAMSEALVARYAPRVSDHVERALLYGKLLMFAREWEPDTVRLRRAVERIDRFITDSFTGADSAGLLPRLGTLADPGETSLGHWVHKLYNLRREAPVLDSLRKSTAAYLAYAQQVDTFTIPRKTSEGKDTTVTFSFFALQFPFVGEHARPIEAEAWAGRDDSTRARPVPGRISLVVFLSPSDCFFDKTWTCPTEMAALRRLATQFPTLDITIVARARGYYLWLNATRPPQEAELIRQMLEKYDLHVPVAITGRRYSWRPTPDGRRVDPEDVDPNLMPYEQEWQARLQSIGWPAKIDPVGRGVFSLLIDENGIIVYSGGFPGGESKLADYINVLIKRRASPP